MSGSPSRHGKCAARSSKAARRFLARLREGRDVRRELVQRVREGISAGRYENDLKVAVAAERVGVELGGGAGGRRGGNLKT